MCPYPSIDLAATGRNIARLRKARGLTVRAMQAYFGFDDPQAIYRWQWGRSLPSVDNLYALSVLFGVSMNEILVPIQSIQHENEQQAEACCSHSVKNFPLHYSTHAAACVKYNLRSRLIKTGSMYHGFYTLREIKVSEQELLSVRVLRSQNTLVGKNVVFLTVFYSFCCKMR